MAGSADNAVGQRIIIAVSGDKLPCERCIILGCTVLKCRPGGVIGRMHVDVNHRNVRIERGPVHLECEADLAASVWRWRIGEDTRAAIPIERSRRGRLP